MTGVLSKIQGTTSIAATTIRYSGPKTPDDAILFTDSGSGITAIADKILEILKKKIDAILIAVIFHSFWVIKVTTYKGH